MPDLESRVKEKVVAVLAAWTQIEASLIEDKDRLTYDLGITKTEKRLLAKPFTKISEHENGSRVTQPESGSLTTVKKAWELVVKKAKAGQ